MNNGMALIQWYVMRLFATFVLTALVLGLMVAPFLSYTDTHPPEWSMRLVWGCAFVASWWFVRKYMRR